MRPKRCETSKQATLDEQENADKQAPCRSFLFRYSMYDRSEYLVSRRFEALEDSSGPPSFNSVSKIHLGRFLSDLLCFLNRNKNVSRDFNLFNSSCSTAQRISSAGIALFTHSLAYTSSTSRTYIFTRFSRLHDLAFSSNSNMCLTPCSIAYLAVSLKGSESSTPFLFTSSNSSMQSLARMQWPSFLFTLKL